MREILYRGFHPDINVTTEITLNGEKIKGWWVEGLPFGRIGGGLTPHGINSLRADKDRKVYSVFSETVCEYTGLTDKNGKMIFEDDIVEAERYKEVVRFEDGCFHPMGSYVARSGFMYDNNDYEIIGNIFENPELLK